MLNLDPQCVPLVFDTTKFRALQAAGGLRSGDSLEADPGQYMAKADGAQCADLRRREAEITAGSGLAIVER